MTKQSSLLFFDVDTQIDFVEPTGALYVPGAETLKSNFTQLINYARDKDIPVWGSIDAHSSSDPELSQNDGPFPNHCMLGETGQLKIDATKPLNPLWIENRLYQKSGLLKIQKHPDEIYFMKQSFNVLDNPNIQKLISPFSSIAVFGVATDYCVLAAVLGFRKRNKTIYLVIDAIKPVNVNPDDGNKALQEMKNAGAIFITTADIIEGRLSNLY